MLRKIGKSIFNGLKFLGKWTIILGVALCTVTAVVGTTWGWVRLIGFENPDPVRYDFDAIPESNWDFHVNGNAEVQPPPFHAGSMEFVDGIMRFIINGPDPDWESHPIGRQPSGTSARYNNIFGMERTEFSPTLTENVEVVTRYRMATLYGTGGLWMESNLDFGENGRLTSPIGFRGAVGFSYTGEESTDLIDGLRFIYTVASVPICNEKVEGVDVTQWHDYVIVAEKTFFGHNYTLFIDGEEEANCNIPFISFFKSNVQVWRDNFLIRDGLKIDHQNFKETQYGEYDWITIEAVEK